MSFGDQFTFDAESGAVSGPSDALPGIGKRDMTSGVVCVHLRGSLASQISHGAKISYVTGPGAWSKIDLDVSLEQAIADLLPSETELLEGVEYWSNTDTHYPIQSGMSCAACRQTLSWPTPATGEHS